MQNPFHTTVVDWHADRERLLGGRYGVIETAAGALAAVHLRPWPKLIAWPEIWPVGPLYHARGEPDRCLLYFNQPRRCTNFLALKYVVSTPGSVYATFHAALVALDALAELKGVDAIVCDAANRRISERLLARMGWQPLARRRWRRNFIKRFYGAYPGALAAVLGGAEQRAAS